MSTKNTTKNAENIVNLEVVETDSSEVISVQEYAKKHKVRNGYVAVYYVTHDADAKRTETEWAGIFRDIESTVH